MTTDKILVTPHTSTYKGVGREKRPPTPTPEDCLGPFRRYRNDIILTLCDIHTREQRMVENGYIHVCHARVQKHWQQTLTPES